MDFFKLVHGRTALVAGATAGIGWAVSKSLCDNQVNTFMADINAPPESIECATFLRVDLSKPDAADQIFEAMNIKNLLPDILICNAGRGIQEKLVAGDPAKWKYIFDLNLMGHLRLIRAFVPAMQSNNRADVIFISSVAASQPHPYGGIYSASKAALENIAETLRQECTPQVRVTTITPGVVNSKFFENQVGGDKSAESFGWGYLEPDDVAEAVLYALSRPARVAVNNITIRPRAQLF
ncbi:MAG: SDR family oxidoreductase [Cyclobacteriaceae bacterium]